MAFGVASIRKAQKKKRPSGAPLPPMGSYDPSILLQYAANQRASQDAQSQFDLAQAQAQDDFAIQSQRLHDSSSNSLADILTGRQRLQESASRQTADLKQNYGDLAGRQAEGALKANVQSKGLLAQALARRKANYQHDQGSINTALQQGLADSTTAEKRLNQQTGWNQADLALQLSRAFGSGTKGAPLGSNVLNLTQTKNNALMGNLDLSSVAYQQAAANGLVIPRRKKRTVIV